MYCLLARAGTNNSDTLLVNLWNSLVGHVKNHCFTSYITCRFNVLYHEPDVNHESKLLNVFVITIEIYLAFGNKTSSKHVCIHYVSQM